MLICYWLPQQLTRVSNTMHYLQGDNRDSLVQGVCVRLREGTTECVTSLNPVTLLSHTTHQAWSNSGVTINFKKTES